jgi:hypothetical protein
MKYVPARDFTKLTRILDKLHEYFPNYGIDIKITDTGWHLVLYTDSDDVGYLVQISDQQIITKSVSYLAELIYDKIATSRFE